jgi:lipopolysaccharide export system protein LptA
MTGRVLAFAVAATCGVASTALAQKAILPGGNSRKPIDIEAAKLDYFDKAQKLVYSGHVVATQGDARLAAASLVIYLTPRDEGAPAGPPASSNEVQRMEAAGPVTLTSKDQIGTGDRGIYEKGENKVILLGNVTLSQGPNVTTGDKLVYDLSTSQAVVVGRVRSMFVPKPAAGEAAAAAKTPAARTPAPKLR